MTDMRPVRSAVMAGAVTRFIRAFFDENPLSQLALIVMRNGVAEQLSSMSSSPVRGCMGVFGCAHSAGCMGVVGYVSVPGVGVGGARI
jgi:hypothetical protein